MSTLKTDAETDAFETRVDSEMLREGRQVAIKVAIPLTLAGAAALTAALRLLSGSLASASEIIGDKGEFWYESFMPCVLVALVGGALGAALGWRITNVAGLTGMPGWTIGATGVAIAAVVGIGVAAAALGVATGGMTLVAAGAFVLAGLGLVSYFTLWSE